MFRRMMFTRVVGAIQVSGLPLELELSLCLPVKQPIMAHIDSFGAVPFDGTVGKAYSGGIVECYIGRGLWISKFM